MNYAAPNCILWFLGRYFCAVFRAFRAIDKGLKEILNIYAVFLNRAFATIIASEGEMELAALGKTLAVVPIDNRVSDNK